jgi:hypothetical protein
MGRVGWHIEAVDREELLRALGFPLGKMPPDAMGVQTGVMLPSRWVQPPLAPWVIATPVAVRIEPTPQTRRKSSRHRTYVLCPDCRSWQPTGRFHQHYQTRVCVSRKERRNANADTPVRA